MEMKIVDLFLVGYISPTLSTLITKIINALYVKSTALPNNVSDPDLRAKATT